MKVGYGTYGMKQVTIADALTGLKAIGYDAVEVTVAKGWPTEPDRLDVDARKKLVEQFQSLELPPPVLLDIISPCVSGEQRKEMLSAFVKVCELSHHLNFGNKKSVITFTLGGEQPEWDVGKGYIADSLLELAQIAESYGAVIAIEPHIGGALDNPNKAVWLMEATQHPNLKLNFDISHFAVQGMDMRYCLDLCSPYSVHYHVKDGRIENGELQFLLPGHGGFDYRDYFQALRDKTIEGPITVEVSGMVWKKMNYDPWESARESFQLLNEARLNTSP